MNKVYFITLLMMAISSYASETPHADTSEVKEVQKELKDYDFILNMIGNKDWEVDSQGAFHITPHFDDDIDPQITITITNPKNRKLKDEKYDNGPLVIYVHNGLARRK